MPIPIVPSLKPLFLATGLAAGGFLTLLLWRRSRQSLSLGFLLLSTGLPFVLIGGKLLYLTESGSWADPLSAAGYSLYGAFSLLLLFWSVFRLLRPFPLRTWLDCVTPGAAIGVFFTRIGCFFYTCCGGIVCDLPWGVQYPRGSHVYLDQLRHGLITSSRSWSQPVHPTQIYEAVFGLAVFLILLNLSLTSHIAGEIFFKGTAWYGGFRFGTEFLRIHTEPDRLAGLTPAQIWSLALLAAGVIGLLIVGKRRRPGIARAQDGSSSGQEDSCRRGCREVQ